MKGYHIVRSIAAGAVILLTACGSDVTAPEPRLDEVDLPPAPSAPAGLPVAASVPVEFRAELYVDGTRTRVLEAAQGRVGRDTGLLLPASSRRSTADSVPALFVQALLDDRGAYVGFTLPVTREGGVLRALDMISDPAGSLPSRFSAIFDPNSCNTAFMSGIWRDTESELRVTTASDGSLEGTFVVHMQAVPLSYWGGAVCTPSADAGWADRAARVRIQGSFRVPAG